MILLRQSAARTGEEEPFASGAGATATAQRNLASGIAEARAAVAGVLRHSPAAIAEGLGASGAERPDHSARPAAENCGLVLVGQRLAGKPLVQCVAAESGALFGETDLCAKPTVPFGLARKARTLRSTL